MEHFLGLLKIRVCKGVNLAVRDVTTSDPYVVIKMGKQKLKTHVVKKNINPVWNEELTMSITDPSEPIKLFVYDKDTFSFDDKMGEAEFEIGTFVEAMRMRFDDSIPSGTIIKRIQPSRQNCLAEESSIVWEGEQVFQNLFLRLRNVESGEIQLKLQWVNIPGSRGL